jgi:hypothetical protein
MSFAELFGGPSITPTPPPTTKKVVRFQQPHVPKIKISLAELLGTSVHSPSTSSSSRTPSISFRSKRSLQSLLEEISKESTEDDESTEEEEAQPVAPPELPLVENNNKEETSLSIDLCNDQIKIISQEVSTTPSPSPTTLKKNSKRRRVQSKPKKAISAEEEKPSSE